MTPDQITAQSNALASLIEERLGVTGNGLESKLNRAGRLLPGWVRRDIRHLVQAEQMTAHPRLMMQTDPTAIEKSYRGVEKWLMRIDPDERRKDRILGLLATNGLNLLLVAALFILTLVLNGTL